MADVVAPLILALKGTVAFAETRAAPASGDYFEAVLLREHLPSCLACLNEAFGAPAKAFGTKAAFERPIQALVSEIGGVREDQCLFVKALEGGQLGYAVLWPWASNAERVTLKVGTWQGVR